VVVSLRDVTGCVAVERRAGPSGFELCGETQASCCWEDARIDGSSIVLPDTGGATRVRYAWGTPVAPLSDGSSLPAGPFEAPIR